MQLQPLVPVHQFDKLPSYYIFAGLVFVPLTQPYLHEYGEDWYNTSPRRLCERALRELPKKAGEQLVVLSQVCRLLEFFVGINQVTCILVCWLNKLVFDSFFFLGGGGWGGGRGIYRVIGQFMSFALVWISCALGLHPLMLPYENFLLNRKLSHLC